MYWRGTCLLIVLASCLLIVDATAQGRHDVMSALAPLPMLIGWLVLRGPQVGRGRWLFLATAAYLTFGTAFGTLREQTASNRVTHAVMAALLAWALWQELERWLGRAQVPAPRLMMALVVFSFAFSLGALMEVGQAVLAWTPPDGMRRWQDTILDMVADAVGAALVALLALRRPSAR